MKYVIPPTPSKWFWNWSWHKYQGFAVPVVISWQSIRQEPSDSFTLFYVSMLYFTLNLSSRQKDTLCSSRDKSANVAMQISANSGSCCCHWQKDTTWIIVGQRPKCWYFYLQWICIGLRMWSRHYMRDSTKSYDICSNITWLTHPLSIIIIWDYL